jgi:RimJ/RimL family protein N-acetyltransferase
MANITFRELKEEDLIDRVKWFNQKEVNQFLGSELRQGTTLQKQRDWYDRFLKNNNRETFVIESDGKSIGNVALTDISKLDSNAGLFLVIGNKYFQGNGIGSQATQFILDFGFNKLHLHKIWLYVYNANVKAIKLYEKFGFKEEGRLKEMLKIGDKYYDEIILAKFNPKN